MVAGYVTVAQPYRSLWRCNDIAKDTCTATARSGGKYETN